VSIKEIFPNINEAIQRERNYQDAKWGHWTDGGHSPREWLAIMEAELEEAKLAWVKGSGDEGLLRELLQVVAVGVACMEQHGCYERSTDEGGSR
jgi:hypothetical protein